MPIENYREKKSEYIKFSHGERSERSSGHENQDFVDVRSDGFFAHGDGVSTSNIKDGGGIASREVKKSVRNLAPKWNQKLSVEQAKNVLISMMIEGNNGIRKRKKEKNGGKISTTASIGGILVDKNGEKRLVAATVGNSPIFVLREGKLILLTRDDNPLYDGFKNKQEAIDARMRVGRARSKSELSPADRALTGLYSNVVSKTLNGSRGVEPSFVDFKLKDGDIVLGATDGVTENCNYNDLEALARKNINDPARLTAEVIELTKNNIKSKGRLRGNKKEDSLIKGDDDMTFWAMKVGKSQSIDNINRQNPNNKREGEEKQKVKTGLQMGQDVRVRRSDGKFDENGWKLVGYNKENKTAKVRNSSLGLEKDISYQLLAEYQKINYKEEINNILDSRLSGKKYNENISNNRKREEKKRAINDVLDDILCFYGLKSKKEEPKPQTVNATVIRKQEARKAAYEKQARKAVMGIVFEPIDRNQLDKLPQATAVIDGKRVMGKIVKESEDGKHCIFAFGRDFNNWKLLPLDKNKPETNNNQSAMGIKSEYLNKIVKVGDNIRISKGREAKVQSVNQKERTAEVVFNDEEKGLCKKTIYL